MLANVKFVQEKRLIGRFFDEISQDTGKFVFTVKDTLACLEMGAVEILIVWESLDCDRYELLNTATSKIEVKHLSTEQVRMEWKGGGGEIELVAGAGRGVWVGGHVLRVGREGVGGHRGWRARAPGGSSGEGLSEASPPLLISLCAPVASVPQ